MKALLADWDGVLNSWDYMRNRRMLPRPTPHPIDALAVPRLNAVTDRTGAKIVVSSTKRLSRTVARLAEIFAAHGITGEVVDKTPSIIVPDPREGYPNAVKRVERGVEIQAWLDAHPECTRFAIVDDNSDMAHLRDRLVLTTFAMGLQDEHVEALCALLGEVQDGSHAKG